MQSTTRQRRANTRFGSLSMCAALRGALLLCCMAAAGQAAASADLDEIRAQRAAIEQEIAQFQQSIALLLPEGVTAADSDNPAVQSLLAQRTALNEKLLALSTKEVALLRAKLASQPSLEGALDSGETKPLRLSDPVLEESPEEREVERLRTLWQQYAEKQEALEPNDSDPDPRAVAAAQLDAYRRDAMSQARIPFSADKVRLSGIEGYTALAQISQRLADPAIPESHRELSPICNLRTRLSGQLVSNESRSLKSVGKGHYLARVRLHGGETVLTVRDRQWHVRLPQDMAPGDYLLTLYSPASAEPELHVIPIVDLLAQDGAYLPQWLPPELDLAPPA